MSIAPARDRVVGLGKEKKGILAALHDSQGRMSWSLVNVSWLSHHHIWGQMSSETHGLPKDPRHGLPGRDRLLRNGHLAISV